MAVFVAAIMLTAVTSDRQYLGPFLYVVVQFHPWFKLIFCFFALGYDNKFETKENKI